MTREAIADVIDYIFQNMSVLAGDLTRLEADLHSALAKESIKTCPAINKVFSGYVSTVTQYSSVMAEISKMLGAALRTQDSFDCAEQPRHKQ